MQDDGHLEKKDLEALRLLLEEVPSGDSRAPGWFVSSRTFGVGFVFRLRIETNKLTPRCAGGAR